MNKHELYQEKSRLEGKLQSQLFKVKETKDELREVEKQLDEINEQERKNSFKERYRKFTSKFALVVKKTLTLG